MALEKGWYIKTKNPANDLFWSLSQDGNFTDDITKAILFARRCDAQDFLNCFFTDKAKLDFIIGGVQ